MIELTYAGGDALVATATNVPFNEVSKHGCAERYNTGANNVTLTKVGQYLVTASANIAVPTGGTVGQIGLAIASDGETVNGKTMLATPAAVNEFFNVSAQTYVTVYPCCCVNVSLRNISGIDINVNNQNLTAVKIA